jgi:hypothetical protein
MAGIRPEFACNSPGTLVECRALANRPLRDLLAARGPVRNTVYSHEFGFQITAVFRTGDLRVQARRDG